MHCFRLAIVAFCVVVTAMARVAKAEKKPNGIPPQEGQLVRHQTAPTQMAHHKKAEWNAMVYNYC